MIYVIDSYAWIEYLDGTDAGAKVKNFWYQNNQIYTLDLVIAEVISRAKRTEKDIEGVYSAIISNSNIISINSEIAKQAGLLHAEIRKKIIDFGLIDAFILVMARKLKAKIITGDKHFKSFKEAVLIK